MATLNVSLTDSIEQWVEKQTKSGGFNDASDYIRDLIRRDRDRADKLTEFQRLITEGIESGVSPLNAEDVLRDARQSVLK